MPRNASGTYSLYTPGNPTVTSTVITTTWANNTLSDIATALTDSLSRSGNGGMTAPLQLAAGAIGTPGLSWTAETTSGFYRASAGNFRYSVSGVDAYTITGAGLIVGAATGGAQGVGTINAVGVYDDGVLLANQLPANPSTNIGLANVNGAAATFMRSDAAPALSQSINPTWTGNHVFSPTSGLPFVGTRSGVNGAGAAGVLSLASDGKTIGDAVLGTLAALNSSSAATNYAQFGTEIISPTAGAETGTFDVLTRVAGSGPTRRFRVQSGMQIGSPTGGDMGAATLNATGLYSSGSQVYPNIPRSTTTTTVALSDLGKCIAVSAAINIPISVFSAGDCVAIYNDSAASINITISAGTLRLAGSTTTGTRALAARGTATLWFNVGGATPEVIASGPGLT